METVIVIVIIVFLIIYLQAKDSKKETKRERYGEAIGVLAHSTADTISRTFRDLTEPASKKEIRNAEEELARRNGMIYRCGCCNDKKYFRQLFKVDERFEKSLSILGLTKERWKIIGRQLFYIGIIRKESRDSSNYAKKNSEWLRSYIFKDSEDDWSYTKEWLEEALDYFNIPVKEWIKYGDTVIEMHNIIENNKDLQEFGYIAPILPMANNEHLL